MKTLEQSIKILEEYLHYEVFVDPLEANKSSVSRIYFSETDLYWSLVACEKENINSEKIDLPIGGGYIVDKENGDIYMMGSSPFTDWHEEFKNFKLKKESIIDWKPIKNDYLKCKEKLENKMIYSEEYITCLLKERELKIESFIREKVTKGIDKCIIFFKPFESDPGKIKIGSELRSSNTKINIISLLFNGSLEESSTILIQLKKYLRVNNYKSTGNYWIEVQKNDLIKDYPNWNFEYKMEFEKKEAPANIE